MRSRRQFIKGCSAAAAALPFIELGKAAPSGAFSQYDEQAKRLIARLTLDQKIGQMTQPDYSYLKSEGDIGALNLGSVLSGGDTDPKSGNDLISWTDLYDRCQASALHSITHIPIVYGLDCVHGNNNVIGATVFPHNMGLGCTRNPDLVEKAARVTANETRATGINWAFAPCVAVPQDIRWGRVYEGYSQDPGVVKTLGEAAVRGLQGASLSNGLSNPLSVLACAKHYVADGGTIWGTGKFGLDQGDAIISEEELRRVFLPGYITTIQAGVGTIMPSYNSWNGVKCSASKQLLTDLLKTELGFEGFLISDYAAINEISGTYKQQIQISINAGMDMVMIPDKYMEFINLLRELVDEGKVPMSRIDDAVLRILRVKFAMGLMQINREGIVTYPNADVMADRSLHREFGSAAHRAVARDCVKQSLVLLKNGDHVLPLAKNAKHIHLAGKTADNLGNQCGGWTVTWQGQSGDPTIGTTILTAVRSAVSPLTKVTYSLDGEGASGADVAVAVIGETPYAEFMGDRPELLLDPQDIGVVTRLKAQGLKVVVIIVSGRPLLMDAILNQADAVIAAWLPGTEGDGVADVLFGDHKPSGKLSYSWPKASTRAYRIGDPGYESLFEFGYGLSY